MNEILELETRRKIFDIVSKNPGLHLSKIAEMLSMRVSLVEYHLLYMEKNQVVHPVRKSGYVRYYIKGEVGTEDKKILAVLRQKIPLRILLLLLKHDKSQHKDILKNLDIAPSTLSYHLKKLVKHEIIAVHTYGEERGYSIGDKEKIVRFLIQYKPYTVIEGFKDIWVDLGIA
jgi:predicted transcriptional regulator